MESTWERRYLGFVSNKQALIEKLGREYLKQIIDALICDKEACNHPLEVANLLRNRNDFQKEMATDEASYIRSFHQSH